MTQATGHVLRMTAYPTGPGPYDRWELTVEATRTVLASGTMPVNMDVVRAASAAYHAGRAEQVLG